MGSTSAHLTEDYDKDLVTMKMNNFNPSASTFYSTRDFWCAGALLATGKNLLRLDWQNGRAFFVFPDLDKCEQAAQAYWAGDLKVSAKTFADALRTLKSRLYENENANQQKNKNS